MNKPELTLPPHITQRVNMSNQVEAQQKQFLASLAFEIYSRRVNILNAPIDNEYETLAKRALLAAKGFIDVVESI